MSKILIKVDEGKRGELKSFHRMDALAQVLQKYCEITFYCDAKHSRGISYLRTKGYNVYEYADLLGELERFKGDCIIIDSPLKTKEFNKKCPKIFKKIICVDEQNDNPFMECDMIINPVYGSKQRNYFASNNCEVIGDKDALLIRDEFLHSPMVPIEDVKNILMFVDHVRTEDLLIDVTELNYNIKVILANGMEKTKKMQNRIKSKRVEFFTEDDFDSVVWTCDMALMSYNNYMYDLIGIGMPTIGVVVRRTDIVWGQNLWQDMLIEGLGIVGMVSAAQMTKQVQIFAQNRVQRQIVQNKMQDLVSRDSKEALVDAIMAVCDYSKNT